ncbi:MAG: hypothetical protein A3G43_14450 [Ignavibacteria bacterium RIFCSPLOWO2_12_FULL_56_21]|nr:MAG: hypothetical protein A2X68_12445 [Ignavibacteria bacterium GWC2_56_12]OGU65430.1 MAG: hypothetical protein A3C56_02565 [Ignavibacteria bacterium RIFCSPHIGHO2_02_FULL_56_12]OGU74940.1 MAG: hypothetical protein A3G43_14450 [Ignavibacteria bacterium RIFCSPLOWO2_12_FULL_56_21]
MKLLIFFLLPVALYAQSPVRRLVSVLDSITVTSFNDWRISPDLRTYRPAGDPRQPEFDDSGWDILKIDQSVYPDSCWIRKEIALPAKILGRPVSGSVRFVVSVDDYGSLWVNGSSLGHFPWDGDFELTPSGQPGQRFVLAIRAINTGGPLRLLRAEVRTSTTESIRQAADDLILSLRVGEKLLSFDTYQTNATRKVDPGVDKSTIPASDRRRLNDVLQSSTSLIDVGSLTDGPESAFAASIERWKEAVKPVSDFAKQFSLQFSSNAHIDAAWLWRSVETIEVCNNTFRSANNILDARPDATYSQSAAAYYDWMERLYPETFEKIRKRVKEGRWEITGGMWVEPDCNLPSGDSWARHLLYAKRYFKEKFGVDVKIGWNPDSFGYNGNMPMIYQQAGVDVFITQKIGWNDTNVFPHRIFWWESPDGSRILSLFPFDYVNDIGQPHGLVDWLRQFEANTGFRKLIVLFGIGNHGGGPTVEMMKRIDRLKTLAIYPTVEFGTSGSYVSWLRKQDLTTLPVWKDELYLEYHQGTFTTQAAMKKENRENETLLTSAETFGSIAGFYGRPYPADALRTAWRTVLFNQFHDILPGSGIREVYIDAAAENAGARATAEWELNGAFEHLASRINTATLPAGNPVVLFNTLAWNRNEIACVQLPTGDTASYAVFTSDGREVPSQFIRRDRLHAEIIFPAEVPSLGHATYLLRKGSFISDRSRVSVSSSGLENERFRLVIDPSTGWVSSIFDKQAKREILAGPANELQVLEDKPRAWDAWNIGLTGVKYPVKFRKMEVVERGPLRATLRLHYTYLKPGVKKEFPTEDFPSTFFTQDITLNSGIDRIDFTTVVDWWEEKTMLKVAFPVAVDDSAATYEIPYGTIRRSTRNENSFEKAQIEVPSHRWADLSDGGYGVSLLNRSKYGHDIKGNVMRLSLLRSPKWPDPTADRGKHVIEYALWPHSGTWSSAGTVRRGYEYNSPLKAVFVARHRGPEPAVKSYIGLIGNGLILTSVKRAEEGNAWVATLYNTLSANVNGEMILPRSPKKAVRSDILESSGETLRVSGRSVRVSVGPQGLAIVRLEW